MDRWNYNDTRERNGSFAGPFLMGLAVGIAGAAVYAAARSGRLGSGLEQRVHGFEEGAVNMKNTVVEKAAHAKDTVVEKAVAAKDAVVSRFSGGTNGEAASAVQGGSKSRDKQGA